MDSLLNHEAERWLQLGLAFFWTVTYLLIILQGFRDRTCGMPLLALCANITWEFLYGFVIPFDPFQKIGTIVWFALDCVIFLQFLLYATRKTTKKKLLYLSVAGLLVMALLLHYGMHVEFHDKEGKYSAFGINLMMSLLFILMWLKQPGKGQSLAIAYAKMIGTLCASILGYAMYPESLLLTTLYILTFLLDLLYVIVVTKPSPLTPPITHRQRS
ncbi:hypothetical protein [Paenibacillus ferrarius]|uniref:transmembrane-type terpene cyclase n=1 Tax=Paenibacillus ferrarius TaxID=1469647 RepID=UPI003D267E5D